MIKQETVYTQNDLANRIISGKLRLCKPCPTSTFLLFKSENYSQQRLDRLQQKCFL